MPPHSFLSGGETRRLDYIRRDRPGGDARIRLRQPNLSLLEELAAVEQAVTANNSVSYLGEIGLNEIPDWPEADKIEVGWELDPAWWGRGLAPEGGRAALEFGFGVHQLPRIISVTRPDNANSRRVMEKLGLTCQGERPFRGAPAAVWYALDRETWLNSTV